MAPGQTGHYLCETCFDAMTDLVIVRDGLPQACCVACQAVQQREPWEEMPVWDVAPPSLPADEA
jgi:NMD protein affecting ribosome stability and mRNA decay